jgi:MFS transporter, OFA family, oxalate/formate antiporter
MKHFSNGWVVLIGLLLMYAASNGISLNTVPLFFPDIMKEFGIDQAQIQRGPALLFLLIALLSPLMGYLLDRYNARLLITVGAVGLVLDILFFSQIGSYPKFLMFYVAYSLFLTLCGIISSMYLVTNWFDKHRGKAVGILLLGSSLGGAIFPPLAGKWIKTIGWHGAAYQLSFIAAAFILIPLLFIRNKERKQVTQSQATQSLNDVTLKQAASTPTFYFLLVGTSVLWFCINGIINNNALYLKDLQLDSEQSGKILGIFFTCAMFGKLIFGFLSDYFSKKNIMLLAIVNLLTGAILLKMTVTDTSLLKVYAICFGIGFSGAFTMIQLLVAELYQGRHYGRILGVVTIVETLAGSAGALGLGILRKTSGSYLSSFQLMIVLCVVALVATAFVKKTTIQNANRN